MLNYYQILGVKNFASLVEIKTAYRKLSKKFHPDVNEGDKFFEEKFKEIQNAYEHLTNSRLKVAHDEALRKYNSFEKTYTFQKSEPKQDPKEEQKPREEQTSREEQKNTEAHKKSVNQKRDIKVKFPSLRTWVFLLIIPALLIFYFTVLNTPSKSEVTEGSGKLFNKYIFEGQATNTTFNKTSEATLEMLQLLNNQYECLGKFDEINLFGRFDIIGKVVSENSDSLVVNFIGNIYFVDGNGSSFKNGTNTSFHLLLTIFSDSVIGNYTIDEIPDTEFSKMKQTGQLNLKVKSKTLVHRVEDR
ncbi:MAG: J domain-containing protein [Ferruginibacter sp.]